MDTAQTPSSLGSFIESLRTLEASAAADGHDMYAYALSCAASKLEASAQKAESIHGNLAALLADPSLYTHEYWPTYSSADADELMKAYATVKTMRVAQ